MRELWTADRLDSLRRNWKRPEWVQVIIEETGLSEKQIKNKASRMGLRRKRDKGYKKLKKETFADPQPAPDCLKQGRCPHGGLVWFERVPATQSYNAVCIHGGRWEV